MVPNSGERTVHVVTGRPWQDATISLMAPGSPRRPWRVPGVGAQGDAVVAVIETDPVSVVNQIGIVGPDGDMREALAGSGIAGLAGLVELNVVTTNTGLAIVRDKVTTLRGDEADVLCNFMTGMHGRDTDKLFGHNTLTQARILLHSEGRCTVCDGWIDWGGSAGGDIHTADAGGADWPAALCTSCSMRMRDREIVNVPELVFSQRPQCPRCGARHARSALFGLPMFRLWPPWIALMGCVVTDPRPDWCCGVCQHCW